MRPLVRRHMTYHPFNHADRFRDRYTSLYGPTVKENCYVGLADERMQII